MSEKRPSKLLLWLEARAIWEMASLPFALPALLQWVPRGDGHSVLVLPGLLGDDSSTIALRGFLGSLGYDVHGWGQGPNLGPRKGVFSAMQRQLAQIHATSGRKVSVLGWSLGGVYAREVARTAPQTVRQVITLGSPLYGDPQTSSNAAAVYRFVRGSQGDDSHLRIAHPPPVPTTSIYSRTDGIVGWGCSVEKQGPQTDNIEVNTASHAGLGTHPLVLYAIGDRLAQSEGEWQHFKPRGLAQWLYPSKAPQR